MRLTKQLGKKRILFKGFNVTDTIYDKVLPKVTLLKQTY